MKFKEALSEKMNKNIWVASTDTEELVLKADTEDDVYKRIADTYSDLKVRNVSNVGGDPRHLKFNGIPKSHWNDINNGKIYKLPKE